MDKGKAIKIGVAVVVLVVAAVLIIRSLSSGGSGAPEGAQQQLGQVAPDLLLLV